MGVNGIYGLSGSGIDVESMVKVGMLTKQKQYDKMQQSYTKNEWTKQAYNEVYNKLTTYSTSTLSPYKMSSTMSAKSATSSNSNAVTATANANAVTMNHKVTVDKLSSSAYLVATESLSVINKDPSDADNSVQLQDYIFQSSTYRLTDSTLSITGADGSTISNSSDGNTVDADDTAFEFTVSDGTNTATFKYTYGELLGLTKNTNGSLVRNEGTEKTFNDFVSDFNALGTGIRANYDAVSGKFSFYNKEGGEDNKINFTLSSDETVSNTTAAFFQGMKLAQSLDGELLGRNSSGEKVDFYDNAEGLSSDQIYIGNGGTSASISSSDAVMNRTEIATSDTTLGDAVGTSFDTLEISLNGTTINLGNDKTTISEMISTINAQSDTTNVKASFSDEGIFTLTDVRKGTASKIEITASSDEAKEFLSTFNLLDEDADISDEDALTVSASGKVTDLTFGVSGENGSAVIDGVRYENLKSNNVTAFGVTYSLHNVSTDTVNVNIEQDVDGIIDKVKSFVEDYNKLLSGLYEKYNEKQYSDYAPLTSSQKDTMKEEQIEKWEEKAKSGLLYHDKTLSKITTKMREAISNPIEGLSGKYTSAYSLGISTTGIYGQLTLDEDKLRAALTDDSEAAYNVFSTLSKDDDFDKNGLAQRLSDVMVDATKLIKDRAGTDDSTNDDSDLGTLMRELQNKMSDFKKQLDAFETRLYKKYDAMEVALSTLGMQLSYITGGE